jgi:hypothetical protein
MEIQVNNPFFVAFVIVFVINIMVFFFFRPEAEIKVYFRSLFYMWITTTGIFYLHHKKMEADFKKKMDEMTGAAMVNSVKNMDQMIEPELPKEGRGEEFVNVFEDSLI